LNIGIAYFEYRHDRGIERISAEVADRAARADHEVHYYCFAHEPAVTTGVQFHRISSLFPFNSFKMLHFARRAGRLMKGGGHDVSHSFGNVLGSDVISAQSCHKAGLDLAKLRPHGSISEGTNFGIADRIRLEMERMNFAGRRYKRIIACSTRVQRELIQHYAVPESDVSVIPNGVDLDAFHPDQRAVCRQKVRERHHIGSEEFLLLFVGHEFERKGLETVLRALGRVRGEPITLLVCGGGNEAPFRTLGNRLGVSSKVVFAGSVPDVHHYFGAADAFVMPSMYEPFGLVITEAMASGIPALVSKTAGAAEDLITNGVHGLLLDDPFSEQELAEKITLLAHNGNLVSAIGAAARQRAERTGWADYVARVLDIYAEIIDRRLHEDHAGMEA
jgi:UDP-glucose:(heptosyl)LPS alpha-1,3-glucosyltransferase